MYSSISLYTQHQFSDVFEAVMSAIRTLSSDNPGTGCAKERNSCQLQRNAVVARTGEQSTTVLKYKYHFFALYGKAACSQILLIP
jgi:hypothetical protein